MMKIVSLVAIFLLSVLVKSTTLLRCPCDHNYHDDIGSVVRNIVVCVDQSDLASSLVSKTFRWRHINASVHFKSTLNHATECDFSFSPVVDDEGMISKRRPFNCPDDCIPVPSVKISLSWIRNAIGSDTNMAVTCTLTTVMIRELVSRHQASGDTDLFAFALTTIAFRKMDECKELYMQTQEPETISRRKLKLLVIYTGSEQRKQIMINQQEVFKREPVHGDDAVVTWLATEREYSCNPNTLVCRDGVLDGPTDMSYFEGYPLTDLHRGSKRWNNRTDDDYSGWACAQRRPLRALAHTLQLLDPQLVLLLDDDTFLNWEVLDTLIPYYLHSDEDSPTVFASSASNRTLVGGSGMILGRTALQRLSDFWLYDRYDPRLADHQQVVSEALKKSLAGCVEPAACVGPARQQDRSRPLGVRLVDLCVNMFSNEHTCYHSDHAMSRCFLYAASLWFEAFPCRKGVYGAMCQFHIDSCDIDNYLTCHRFEPAYPEGWKAVGTEGGVDDLLGLRLQAKRITDLVVYEPRATSRLSSSSSSSSASAHHAAPGDKEGTVLRSAAIAPATGPAVTFPSTAPAATVTAALAMPVTVAADWNTSVAAHHHPSPSASSGGRVRGGVRKKKAFGSHPEDNPAPIPPQ